MANVVNLAIQLLGVVEQTSAKVNNICLQLGHMQQVRDTALFTRQYPECNLKASMVVKK